jgi:hypothetical protein
MAVILKTCWACAIPPNVRTAQVIKTLKVRKGEKLGMVNLQGQGKEKGEALLKREMMTVLR